MLKVKAIGSLVLVTLATGSMVNSTAQTMPKKYDEKCLESARKEYVSCMAKSGGSLSAQDQCDKDKVKAEAACKIK